MYKVTSLMSTKKRLFVYDTDKDYPRILLYFFWPAPHLVRKLRAKRQTGSVETGH